VRQTGLRYDPDMGMDARLSCTASGHAWLMTLSDERAMELVSRQGFGKPSEYGPNAPTTLKALLGFLHRQCADGGSCRTGSYQQCIHPVRASPAGQGLKQPSLGRRPSLSSKLFGLNDIYRMA